MGGAGAVACGLPLQPARQSNPVIKPTGENRENRCLTMMEYLFVRSPNLRSHGRRMLTLSPFTFHLFTRVISRFSLLSLFAPVEILLPPSGNCARARHRFLPTMAERARSLFDEAATPLARCSLPSARAPPCSSCLMTCSGPIAVVANCSPTWCANCADNRS